MANSKISEILSILRELNFDEFAEPIVSDDSLDGVLLELKFYAENEKAKKKKLETIIDHLLNFSVGDFHTKIPVSAHEDELDVISLEINTFIEELSANSVNIKTFDNAFNSIQAPFFIINYKQKYFSSINNSALNYFGYNSANKYQIKIVDLLPDSILKELSNFYHSNLSDVSIEAIFQVKNTNRNIIINLAKLDYSMDNKAPQIVMMLFDNTDRYQRIDLENRLRFKDDFLANMSHEIRTPLNAIIGLVNLISKAKNLDAKQSNYIDIIKLNSKTLLELINSILDFSKIEAGKLQLDERPYNLKTDLQKLIDSQSYAAKVQGVNLVLNLPENFVENIVGDQVRLHQIILNLLSNAIKFTKNGKVSLTVLKETETSSTVKYAFYIKDNGIGIAKDKQELIFESFTQLDSNTKRVQSGTGLGLSIVKKLVELHGSTIHLKSDVGKGAEFNFSILFKKEFTELSIDDQQSKMLPINDFFDGLKILLVEDNEFNRIIALETIKDVSQGIEIDTAENGLVALENLKIKQYDIILMDLNMPELDGRATVHKIRQELKLNTPIIVTTCHYNIKEVGGLVDGINDYISKPFESVDLRVKIERVINNKKNTDKF